MGDGGKWVCGLERIVAKKECLIYSFGMDFVSLDMDRKVNSAVRYKWRVLLRS